MLPLLRFAVLAAALIISGCSSAPRLTPADLDALIGAPWVGTLTYLDYTSGRHTTIDSSLTVRRISDEPSSWEFAVGYSREPDADARETVPLSADGRRLGDEVVVLRQAFPGGLRFITESDGADDSRPARFRFEHTLSDHGYSRRKLVRLAGEPEFFERHIYQWSR